MIVRSAWVLCRFHHFHGGITHYKGKWWPCHQLAAFHNVAYIWKRILTNFANEQPEQTENVTIKARWTIQWKIWIQWVTAKITSKHQNKCLPHEQQLTCCCSSMEKLLDEHKRRLPTFVWWSWNCWILTVSRWWHVGDNGRIPASWRRRKRNECACAHLHHQDPSPIMSSRGCH